MPIVSYLARKTWRRDEESYNISIKIIQSVNLSASTLCHIISYMITYFLVVRGTSLVMRETWAEYKEQESLAEVSQAQSPRNYFLVAYSFPPDFFRRFYIFSKYNP